MKGTGELTTIFFPSFSSPLAYFAVAAAKAEILPHPFDGVYPKRGRGAQDRQGEEIKREGKES